MNTFTRMDSLEGPRPRTGRGLRLALGLVLLGLVAPVWAQTCQGVSSARCGTGVGFYVPPPPQPEWKRTWGAIAIDIATDGQPGVFGAVNGAYSRREAKRLAQEKCEATGAQACKVVLWYAGQCAALALPTLASGRRFGARAAETTALASQMVLEECAGPDCEVVHIDCTIPVRVMGRGG
ncbi:MULTISPECIES: DUF4189 domain-containing protein [unclassified Luteimonas]